MTTGLVKTWNSMAALEPGQVSQCSHTHTHAHTHTRTRAHSVHMLAVYTNMLAVCHSVSPSCSSPRLQPSPTTSPTDPIRTHTVTNCRRSSMPCAHVRVCVWVSSLSVFSPSRSHPLARALPHSLFLSTPTPARFPGSTAGFEAFDADNDGEVRWLAARLCACSFRP